MSMKFVNMMNKNKLMNMLIYSILMLPTPMNISMWWNFGSLLGVFLMIQIITGLILSMHYCANVDYAFMSIIHIMKDVQMGWLIRLIHMNGASFYFMLMYIHISRNIYYHSYKLAQVWFIGVTIFFLSMATAFLGYVLPWGQMSFWGATVITNLMSVIPYFGQILVEWVWGGYSINNATLNRFFSLHFILPMLILSIVIIHIFFLHLKGSSNPLGLSSSNYMISFYPYFVIKDILFLLIIIILFLIVICQYPYYLGDPDNFKIANSLSTPSHIKPEWYFLFAYSILRTVPSKLGGVVALFLSIAILYFMPLMKNKIMTNKFYFVNQIYYWFFINNFIMLTWLGGQIIEYPYTTLNWMFTISYFSFFITFPMINKIWINMMN